VSAAAHAARVGGRLHTIEVRLANRPGALYRVLGVVARHGGNIERLLLAPTEDAAVSRATLLVHVADVAAMTRQMRRLLPVLAIDTPPDAGNNAITSAEES
jgi:acetolactate synthase small subunit